MIFKIILPLLAAASSLAAYDLPQLSDASTDVGEELRELNALIGATEENLEAQKKIRSEVEEYRRLQQLYLNDADDRQLLFRIIKVAYNLRETIKQNHLGHAFSKQFLEELNVFAQVANKRSLPKSS